jgi:hypothetical protein
VLLTGAAPRSFSGIGKAAMASREVRVFEVRECSGSGWPMSVCALSSGLAQVDRKTVRRYVEAAVASAWTGPEARGS